jgi:hypothetical protein
MPNRQPTTMNQVDAFPLQEVPIFPSDADLDSVYFDRNGLVVTIASVSTRQTWNIQFKDALGHRVMDEGDLLEFWPICSRPNGVIFEIKAGGWLEQESVREGFLLKDNLPNLREFIVTGENACVNVLANHPPVIATGE